MIHFGGGRERGNRMGGAPSSSHPTSASFHGKKGYCHQTCRSVRPSMPEEGEFDILENAPLIFEEWGEKEGRREGPSKQTLLLVPYASRGCPTPHQGNEMMGADANEEITSRRWRVAMGLKGPATLLRPRAGPPCGLGACHTCWRQLVVVAPRGNFPRWGNYSRSRLLPSLLRPFARNVLPTPNACEIFNRLCHAYMPVCRECVQVLCSDTLLQWAVKCRLVGNKGGGDLGAQKPCLGIGRSSSASDNYRWHRHSSRHTADQFTHSASCGSPLFLLVAEQWYSSIFISRPLSLWCARWWGIWRNLLAPSPPPLLCVLVVLWCALPLPLLQPPTARCSADQFY